MDNAAFLAQVEDLLPELVLDDLVVTAVRPAAGRPWPRAEFVFRFADPPDSWRGPTTGSAYVPLAADWRYASAYDEPADYARLAADAVESAARLLVHPRPPTMPLTSEQVDERWGWLVERLALNGPVTQLAPDRLHVEMTDGGTFTVIVTPEQWATIAEPLDPNADDPQDFNPLLLHDEMFLVFYEGDLTWSVRPELPPVRGGAEHVRRVREARARGEELYGWFAVGPGGERSYFSDSDERDDTSGR